MTEFSSCRPTNVAPDNPISLLPRQLWVPRLPTTICRGQQASHMSRMLLLDEHSQPPCIESLAVKSTFGLQGR